MLVDRITILPTNWYRTNVVEHIQHIYEDEELVENLTCRKFRQVRQEGKRMVEREIPMYHLDEMPASQPPSSDSNGAPFFFFLRQHLGGLRRLCRSCLRLSQQVGEESAHFFGIWPKSPYLCIVNQNKRHLSDMIRILSLTI